MRLVVRVIPKAKKERIEEENNIFKVYVNEPALEGRANKKVIEVLAEYLGVKKYQLNIIQGQKQRDKIIEVIK